LAPIGCDDATGPDDRLWQLDFFAESYDAQSGFSTSCRMVQVLVDEPPPIAPPWTSAVAMNMERRAGSVSAGAWDAEAVTLDFALESLASNDVRLVVSGSYSVTLEGDPMASGGYSGAWTCDHSFPFVDDQNLSDAGFDPTEPIQGFWMLGPLPLPG
jgi:hypothetical protein